MLAAVPLNASSGFQFNDYLLMASEIHLAAGNLALVAHRADTLAELTCYREQGYPAILDGSRSTPSPANSNAP